MANEFHVADETIELLTELAAAIHTAQSPALLSEMEFAIKDADILLRAEGTTLLPSQALIELVTQCRAMRRLS